MRSLVLGLTILFTIHTLQAEEVMPPKNINIYPFTALAKANKDGKKVSFTIRLVDYSYVTKTAKKVFISVEKKIVDGKEVDVRVPKEQVVQYGEPVVKGFREVKLAAKDLKGVDAAGNKLGIPKLVSLLAEEKPILISHTEEIDPFYLLNTRKDAIILIIDQEKVCPMASSDTPR